MIEARNFTYMFYGFAAAWLIIAIYVMLIVTREKRLKDELARLKNLVEDRERK
jgi:CcmD family protein